MAVTAKDPACPNVKLAVAGLVIGGAAGAPTVRVRASVAVLPDDVGGGDGDRVVPAVPRRRAGDGGGAVAVSGEGEPGRQRPALGDGGGREAVVVTL